MAYFYGSMKGARGEVTRTGTKSSGIVAHVRTWARGVETRFHCVNEIDQVDSLAITLTGGSNGAARPVTLIVSALELTAILEGRAQLAVISTNNEDA